MFSALLIIQVLIALAIIALVLLQQGKGADMGAAFGAGSAGTVFGARGGGSFLTRTTAVLAAVFFINSILLSSPLVRDKQDPEASVTERVTTPPASDLPDAGETPEQAAGDLPPADDLPAVPESAEEAASGQGGDDLPPADIAEEPEAQGEATKQPGKTKSDLPE